MGWNNQLSAQSYSNADMKVEIDLNLKKNGFSYESMETRKSDKKMEMAEQALSFFSSNKHMFYHTSMYKSLSNIKNRMEVNRVCNLVNKQLMEEQNNDFLFLDSPIDYQQSYFPDEDVYIN